MQTDDKQQKKYKKCKTTDFGERIFIFQHFFILKSKIQINERGLHQRGRKRSFRHYLMFNFKKVNAQDANRRQTAEKIRNL